MSIRCALEAYKQKEERYPRTLAALAPDYLAEVPADPCSGRDFKYVLKRLDGTGGYDLYSVGPDGDDYGGAVVWSIHDNNGDLLIAPEWEVSSTRGRPEVQEQGVPAPPPAAEEPAPEA